MSSKNQNKTTGVHLLHNNEIKRNSYNDSIQQDSMLLHVYDVESSIAEIGMNTFVHFLPSLSANRKGFFYSCNQSKMKEKTYRSIAKTISWRTVGTIDTILISWLVIGNLSWAMSIGGVELFTKMGLYFVHERTWNKINFGREKDQPLDYHI